MVGAGQTGTPFMWLAWTDVDWGEPLSLVAKLVSKRAGTQCFLPAVRFLLVTSNHPRGGC